MQLQTVLCYSCTYNMMFITQFLKANINYIYSLRVNPPPPPASEKFWVCASIKKIIAKRWAVLYTDTESRVAKSVQWLLGLDDWGLISRGDRNIYSSLPLCPRSLLDLHVFSLVFSGQRGQYFWDLKWLGREAVSSPQSTVKVKNYINLLVFVA
jgi:hypothetical protein